MSLLGLTVLLLALGLVLLMAENVLPTAGALGLLSAACLLLVLYRAFSTSIATGLGYLFAEVVLVPSAYAGSVYLMSRTPLGRATYLRPPEPDEMGVSHASSDLGRLVGHRGRVLTTLRPSGMVDCEGRRLDGLSEGGLIPTGAWVRVVRIQSGRLVVRLDPGPMADPTAQ